MLLLRIGRAQQDELEIYRQNQGEEPTTWGLLPDRLFLDGAQGIEDVLFAVVSQRDIAYDNLDSSLVVGEERQMYLRRYNAMRRLVPRLVSLADGYGGLSPEARHWLSDD